MIDTIKSELESHGIEGEMIVYRERRQYRVIGHKPTDLPSIDGFTPVRNPE